MQTYFITPTFGDDRLPTRFWLKVCVLPNGCWEWTGSRTPLGYGQFQIGTYRRRRVVRAHRWAYEHLVGSVNPGLECDHRCHNRACVNPVHIEPVTHRVNVLRGNSITALNAKKTQCKRGHLFNEMNTVWRRGWRECLACRSGK